MNGCDPTDTALPLAHKPRFRNSCTEAEENLMASVPYRSVLRSLIFSSTRTSPSISMFRSMVINFLRGFILKDFQVMKHLLQYLRQTKDAGGFFQLSSKRVNWTVGITLSEQGMHAIVSQDLVFWYCSGMYQPFGE